MPQNPVRWFEIYVKDMERARRFYESVLEVKLEKLNSPAALRDAIELWSFPSDMNGTGCSGALAKMQGVNPGGMGTIVYFASDDCAIQEKRIREFGGTIQRSKTNIGEYGFIVLAFDTEGNVFGVHSMK